jgi:hypothetical protein
VLGAIPATPTGCVGPTYAWNSTTSTCCLGTDDACKNATEECKGDCADKEKACKDRKDRERDTQLKKCCELVDGQKCCGIKLNTDVPFIGRCIEIRATNNTGQSGSVTTVNQYTVFPRLMRALTNIVLTLIMVGSLIMLIISGVMIASGQAAEGKTMIKRVVISLVLLGASGIILRLINPFFFG